MALMRALRQLGYGVTKLGETYRNGEDGRLYGVLRMPAEYSKARQERTRPVPFVARRPVPEMPVRDMPVRQEAMA